MKSNAATVEQYLQSLPADRRDAISAVREVILTNLPKSCEERMCYGMIGYVVPHSIYPAGYHCDPKLPLMLAFLGSQKNYMAIHLMAVYGHEPTAKWFRKAWEATGKKLDMGKACVRFKKLEDVPLEVVSQVIARVPVKEYIARIEAMLATTKTYGKKIAAKSRKPARKSK